MTLGLSRPNVIGGPIGSRFSEEEFKADDADFDDEDDEDDEDGEDDYDGEQLEDDDEEGMEGDLIGSTKKNDGPPKSFPPDDVDDDEEGEFPDFGGEDDDGEMDDLAAGLDGVSFGDDGGEDDFGGMDDMGAQEVSPDDMFGDDGSDDLAGALGAGMGDEMGGKDLGGDDMDFLNDIDPEMAGMGPEDDGGMDSLSADLDGVDFGGGEEGGEMGDEFGGDEDHMGDEPCPDCNPDGTEEMGEEGCPSCNGLGFIPSQDELGSEFGGGDDFGSEDPFADKAPEKMMSFQKKYMHKDKEQDRDHCNCEQDEFLNSLTKNARNPAIKKNKSGLKEDSLFSLIDPKDVFGEPGQPGFAPSGRVGSIGGGYTQDDISDMPVLGESTNHRGGARRKAKAPAKNKYPTINEWLQHKTKKPAVRSKKRR